MFAISSARSSLKLSLAAFALALCCSSCAIFCEPRPFVTSLSPASAFAGRAQFFLTVDGNEFRPDTFVTWNGGFRPTLFVSSHQLVAAISASDIAVPGTAEVGVFTPPGETDTVLFLAPGTAIVDTHCGGGSSNVLPFTIQP